MTEGQRRFAEALRKANANFDTQTAELMSVMSAVTLQRCEPLQDDWDDALNLAAEKIMRASWEMRGALRALRND